MMRRRLRYGFLAALTCSAVLLAAPAYPTPQSTGKAVLQGSVHDTQSRALGDVTIRASLSGTSETVTTKTSLDGTYRIELPPGTYAVLAARAGFRDETRKDLTLANGQSLTVSFVLEPLPSGNPAELAGEFSDTPNYTVSGVTDTTNLGGHNSDVMDRAKESLAKATASLNATDIAAEKERVAKLQSGPDTAEIHALLADIAEHEGHPLDAVKEYEKAAAMDPSEENLFALGAELLLHGATEPAVEVFARGAAKYPSSTRMALGHAASLYSLRESEEADRLFAAACDIHVGDPKPYLFLGQLQNARKTEPKGWTERLARYARAHPDDGLAQYNYAVALLKESGGEQDNAEIETLLRRAIALDANLGDAYLQLGILYSSRGEYVKAIPEYQQAIAHTAIADKAHFRLAEAYRHTGQADKAKEEVRLYQEAAQQRTEATEQERHAIPQFVYTLHDAPAATPPTPHP